MIKKIAVLLSGCGVYDGSEIQESVITLLRLSQLNTDVKCFAPNISQNNVINHFNKKIMVSEKRNVLIESARITRGFIKDITQANVNNFDALIIPGGVGLTTNFSNFSIEKFKYEIQKDVLNLTKNFAQCGKPIGLICIAPMLAPKIYGNGVRCTIGNDHALIKILKTLGAEHVSAGFDEIIEDKKLKLITTPAYMVAKSISEAAIGINKLVDRVIQLSD